MHQIAFLGMLDEVLPEPNCFLIVVQQLGMSPIRWLLVHANAMLAHNIQQSATKHFLAPLRKEKKNPTTLAFQAVLIPAHFLKLIPACST